jgi:hypothetical protein
MAYFGLGALEELAEDAHSGSRRVGQHMVARLAVALSRWRLRTGSWPSPGPDAELAWFGGV